MAQDCAVDTTPKQTTYLPLVGDVDGRTRPALAFKAIVADIIADLGGERHVSRAQLELARRAAGLGVLAAQHEAKILAGEPVEAEAYCAIVNGQGRALSRLGLKRVARDVSPPDLRHYINGQAEPEAGDA